MTRVIVDEGLRDKLNGCTEEIEFCDESGQHVGHFVPAELYRKMLYAYAESRCPYTKEEQERHQRETGGRPLADIWASLGR